MRKIYIITFITSILLFVSCSTELNDSSIDINNNANINKILEGSITVKNYNGRTRLAFPSTEYVGNTMEQLISGKKLKDIAPDIKIKKIKRPNQFVLQNSGIGDSIDNIYGNEFLSYADYVTSEFLAMFPEELLELLESDPDYESFKIIDDVDIELDSALMNLLVPLFLISGITPVGDFQFASILNIEKEVQVGSKIYKYVDEGVVVVDEEYISELDSVEYYLSQMNIEPNYTGENITMPITQRMAIVIFAIDENGGSGGGVIGTPWAPGATPPPVGQSLTLTKVNKTIPASNIRDISYYSSDGTWMNWLGNVIFGGRKSIAINKFNEHKRLKFSFYDRNYYIWQSIGTEIQMQKKIMELFWVNTNAEDMVLGYDGIEFRAFYPYYIEAGLPKLINQTIIYPIFDSPYHSSTDYKMVHYSNFDIATKDMDHIFKTMYKFALQGTKTALKFLDSKFNNVNENGDPRISVYGINGQEMYIIEKPDEIHAGAIFPGGAAYSIEKSLYFEMWPGYVQIGFDPAKLVQGIKETLLGVTFNIKGITHTKLHRGVAYGAVKYGGVWKAARIIKEY